MSVQVIDPDRFRTAPDFPTYLETVEKNRALWLGLWERAHLTDRLARAARQVSGRWHLLALSEDWCGDAVNTLPWVARFARAAPEVDFRVLGRDENPDLMDAHLTDGSSRSIPVVVAYDEPFRERGWWGPRPGPLQRWVRTEGQKLPSGERYRRIRRWYALDRGWSVVRAMVILLGGEDPGPSPRPRDPDEVLVAVE